MPFESFRPTEQKHDIIRHRCNKSRNQADGFQKGMRLESVQQLFYNNVFSYECHFQQWENSRRGGKHSWQI